jgi:hypothetical protein
MIAVRLLVCPVLSVASIQAFAGIVCPTSLPNPLPLDQTIEANTCAVQGSTPCSSTTYESPISTTTLTLDSASAVSVALTAAGPPGFSPTLYVSGGICDVVQCYSNAPLPPLPAGSYCMTVTASPFDSMGACGCFAISVHASVLDSIFDDGFEVSAGLASSMSR